MKRMTLGRTVAAALAISLIACDLLVVNDPTAIEARDVENADGADRLRRDAVTKLYVAVDDAAYASGHFTDEMTSHVEWHIDSRQGDDRNLAANAYSRLQVARAAATLAIPHLQDFGASTTKRPHVGEMFAVRGYVAMSLAENFCAGFPLHEIVDFQPVYGEPLGTAQVFERAVADFDSALVYAGDSARIINVASIGRARALLGLGRFSEAATAAANVPTTFEWSAEYSGTGTASRQLNVIGFEMVGNRISSVANREGGSGLAFVDAEDPRLPLRLTRQLLGTNYYVPIKYDGDDTPILMAGGIEARLIEAEAALRAGDPSWLVTLNELRANQLSPPMEPLQDPGSERGRVDLLFRERAFWLFGTGHRVGDFRRLIDSYDRRAEDVFPTGTYYLGTIATIPRGVYGPLTSLPFPVEQEIAFSPRVTGCTSND